METTIPARNLTKGDLVYCAGIRSFEKVTALDVEPDRGYVTVRTARMSFMRKLAAAVTVLW